jgi:hypothetical protein
MIGADRRGMQAAYEVAAKSPRGLPTEEIEGIARKKLATMQAAGCAHLEPESEFIRGFVQEFQVLRAPRSSSL